MKRDIEVEADNSKYGWCSMNWGDLDSKDGDGTIQHTYEKGQSAKHGLWNLQQRWSPCSELASTAVYSNGIGRNCESNTEYSPC